MRHRNPNMNEIDRQRNAKLFLTKLSMEAHEKEEKRLRKERYMTKKAEKMNKAQFKVKSNGSDELLENTITSNEAD